MVVVGVGEVGTFTFSFNMILVLITSKGVVRKALIPPLQTIHTFRGNKVIFMMIMMMGVRIIPLYCWCLIIFEERIHPIKNT